MNKLSSNQRKTAMRGIRCNADVVQVAEELATAVFSCGNELDSPTTRIQFMSGQWPHGEKPQGGLIQASLETVLAVKLRELFNIE